MKQIKLAPGDTVLIGVEKVRYLVARISQHNYTLVNLDNPDAFWSDPGETIKSLEECLNTLTATPVEVCKRQEKE